MIIYKYCFATALLPDQQVKRMVIGLTAGEAQLNSTLAQRALIANVIRGQFPDAQLLTHTPLTQLTSRIIDLTNIT